MVLVGGHGPFTWGTSPAKAAYHALILEELCKMALLTLSIDPKAQPLPEHILAKHWQRKHGAGAYYGQK
jgi:L-ribulose-5-phosphate 4-epimerase